MADYFVVLNRTLSGFGNPNPQLRTKLYERARITIRKQLDGRKPPIEQPEMVLELEKLEQAIADIEAGFADKVPPLPGETDTSVAEAVANPPVAPVAAVPEPETVPDITQLPQEDVQIAPADIAPAEIAPAPPAVDLISEALSEFTEADAARKQVVQPIPEQDEELFNVTSQPDVPEELLPTPNTEPVPAPVIAVAEPVLEPAIDPATEFFVPAVDLPSVNFDETNPDDTLAIPPAPGFEGGLNEPRGSGRWVKLLLAILVLGGMGFAAWAYQGPILDQINQWRGIEDPTKPKPVKTISVKPEPAQPEPVEQESQAEPIVQPKREQRLSDNGEEVIPAEPAAISEPAPVSEPVAEKTAVKPGTESAILYEQGADDSSSKSDAGRTSWSLIQESPSPGEPTEAAIRAQIEIPDRKTVLIMTIKRNTDPALSASHLIELVFAVPDDFSGGSIEEINRFVLKQSEQGRGDPLFAVPVKISAGIFLIALDNVGAARATNETLLKTREWIDIPVRYRTGRKALVTIEKGVTGNKVFEEAFADWDSRK